MAPNIHSKIISREFVKASSSAPKNHNLSFFDHLLPSFYVPLIFFYNTRHGETRLFYESKMLKTSLSAALSHYYPLAGRIRDNSTLDCNNNGVLFLEATMECNLFDILNNPHDKILSLLLPDSLNQKDSSLLGPVAAQVTYFNCGGMSIGLCLCHKVLDMASMSSFINDWASLARKSNLEIKPELDIRSLYPPVELSILKEKFLPLRLKDCVMRTLVFYGPNIDKLKAMVANQVENPTRVEVVSAVLSKSVICATSIRGCLRASVIDHSINLRTRVSPPLSKRNIGNISWNFPVSVRDDKDVEIGQLVKKFRQSKTRFMNFCGSTSNEELCSLILRSMKPASEHYNVEHEKYTCSSWCKFPFYEADFGWGKPLWVTTVLGKLSNMIILIDTREGDGIEAYITLEEEAMAMFDSDKELLSLSNINPSI